MILGRRRLGVLLLAVAAVMFSLILLSTASSGAQARAVARAGGAVAVAGDDECVEVGAENKENQQIQQNGGDQTSQDGNQTTTDEQGEDEDLQQTVQAEDTGQQQTLQEVESDGRLTLQGGSTDNQQTQSGDVQLQNQNGDVQAQEEDNELQQSEQDVNDNGDAQQNGDEIEGQDQTLQDGEDGAQTPGAEANADDECVVADTIPDDLLPPTGAPAKPQASKSAVQKKKSDSGEKVRSGTKKKRNSSARSKKVRSSTGKLSKSYSRTQKLQQKKRSKKQPKASGRSQKLENRGGKPETEDRTLKEPSREQSQIRSKSAPSRGISSEPASLDLAPRLAATEWAQPTDEEIASANQIRRFPSTNPASKMTLSVRAMGLYNVPVKESKSQKDLDNGLISMPGTSKLGERDDQKNVYIAGHYLGRRGTMSRLVFSNLNQLNENDEVVLKDDQGRAYKYRVSEKFEVPANAAWVMGEVRNRDMVTLQTCLPPYFDKRLIVRADRIKE